MSCASGSGAVAGDAVSEKLTVEETLRLFRSFYKRGISVDESIRTAQLEEKRGGAWALSGRAEAAAGHGLRAGGRSGAAVSG
jgi:hypothetical protein